MTSTFGTLRTTVSALVTQLLRARPVVPLDAQWAQLPEIERVILRGYRIEYWYDPPSRAYQRWLFAVRYAGRRIATLEVHVLTGKPWLYVATVSVERGHQRRGLATALLLAAVKTTRATVVTTSTRTPQGIPFFTANWAMLQRYGVELLGNESGRRVTQQ